jgi:membrane fusion protein, copper/silver efflux system
MTSSEKKVFLLGAGAGVVAVLLIGGVVAVRSTHVFASQPADAAAPAEARTVARVPASEPQQGTQPGATLQLTPSEMTAAGVQVAEVRTAVLKMNIDAFGRVEQPESQLAAVSAWIGGRVDKLYVQYTGERVRRGQRVAEVYSPEVATALEEHRLAQENRGRLGQSDDAYARAQAESLVAASQRKLELWGITPDQIENAVKGAPSPSGVPHVTIYAGGAGTVVERKVTQGQYVNAGETLLTLADLSEIWIKVDVYEDQLPPIHPGQDVEITTAALPNRTLHGHVQFIEPTTNPQTRTVQVHVHLANPEMRLMPGMFVSATFVSRAERAAPVVPRLAVLDTGTRKIVYVASDNGVFEAREVQVGAPSEDLFPVINGLKAGDKVVLNGNFMIDSQAQLTSGMSGLYGGSKEFESGQPQAGAAPGSNGGAVAAKIELRAAAELKAGEDSTFQAMLTDANGKPISDAQVTVTLVMPAMPAMNMPEMKNSFPLTWAAGRQMYVGKGNVPMAGSWSALVEARKSGAVIASARTRLSAKKTGWVPPVPRFWGPGMTITDGREPGRK